MRQLVGLGVLGAAAFAGLMAALAFASSLTSSRGEHIGAVDFDRKAISVALWFEPPQLDSTRTQDVTSSTILEHVMEGLLRYDVHRNLVPGVAERWDIRPDGATFWLRHDALWSDGRPVTAHDFVFAWRTAVEPQTASPYAFLLYAVKNGEAVNSGKMPPEALGVRAVDDRTLEVEFENPIAYFDKLAVFATYYPVREDFYRSMHGSYGADADKLLYNGPFMITSWVHGASLRLQKNPHYWDRDSVKLETVDFAYITTDLNAQLNLYRNGDIASVERLTPDALDQALNERWPLGHFSDGSIWYLALNHRPGRVTSNYHFRKALQLVNDNPELVNKVLRMPSYTPADSIFPSWIKGEHGYFLKEHPPPPVVHDAAAARKELETARRELGLSSFPPLVILCDDSPLASKTAEYYQNLYMRTLGLRVRIDKQIFKQRLAKSLAGDFDLIVEGWSPDYDDALTFGDLFSSWNLNNHGKYVNPKLDEQVRIAQRSLDPAVRMAAFAEIQRILIDDVAIIVNYERGQLYVQDPHLKGVTHNAIGAERAYTHAYLVANP
ncbi:MAG TPA: peptide ABC transporter substrate-binding protein [Gammaproteobacteria bacterium]|nr:peptide ABC transporter substrate-binding protein [Gammaproteobacteria bacterium]